MINLAIFSPNKNTYSETFIHAHKSLPFNIKYYYGGVIPTYLENEGYLSENRFSRVFYKIYYKVAKKFDPREIALRNSLKKNKVQVILAEYGITAADTLHVIKSLNIPLIVHFHGYDASCKDILRHYAEKYKAVFNYAFAIIAVSEHMHRQLIVLGCPKEKLHLNHYGAHPDFSKVQPVYQKPQFISIGRFVDKKAPYLTILAFQKVLKKHPEAQLVMGGDGSLLNTCENLIKILGLEKSIRLKGILNKEEIITLFETSIAYVQHSIVAKNGDSEGTPVAIIEAQAAGLPVISTYHAGIPDIVVHQETGFLCKELDINMMSSHMIKLLDEPELAYKMGNNAKERIKRNFSLTSHLNKIEQLICQCNLL